MKAKIIKEINIPLNWFKVYADNRCVKCFSYKEDMPEGDLDNEKVVFDKAMQFVKLIEASDSFPIEETIYETETLDKKDDISNIL